MKKILENAKVMLIISFAIILTLSMAEGFKSPCSVYASGRKAYGVFIGVNKLDYKKLGHYNVVVIDAEYFTKSQISRLKRAGVKKVYSYLNIGSIEEFRDYYDSYSYLTLAEYDNWPGEYWIDVTNRDWQQFCIGKAASLREKGVDGMFIDNCDVYYQFKTDEIYQGLVDILSAIKAEDLEIIINGGDTFVTRCLKEAQGKIFDAVNQESVYTRIDFESNRFKRAKKSERKYFTSYLGKVKKAGVKVYVLEYATSKSIARKARNYAKKHGWRIYVASNLNLTYN